MNYFTHVDSPIGKLTLSGTEDALTGLWIEGQKYYAYTMPPDAVQKDDLPVFQETERWLRDYFRKKTPGSFPALRPSGTSFRTSVWNELLKIPQGETVTYGELAARVSLAIGRPTSARATAGAVAHNPISILIPCHRVVAADGMGGYAGGIERKMFLLGLEKRGN